MKNCVKSFFTMISPNNVKRKLREVQQMTPVEMVLGFFKLIFYIFYSTGGGFGGVLKYLGKALINLMRGPPPVKKEEEKPPEDFSVPIKAPALTAGPGADDGSPISGMLAILGGDEEPKAEVYVHEM
jgi:hypothetical protein